MQNTLEPIECPELFIGLVGPIGVDLDLVVSELTHALKQVRYEVANIHLTEIMNIVDVGVQLRDHTYYDRYDSRIRYANAVRKKLNRDDSFAMIAASGIRSVRRKLSGKPENPKKSTAYIIRQFKRPEEVELLRRVYGRLFVQVSVYGSQEKREMVLFEKIRNSQLKKLSDSECRGMALNLVARDAAEENTIHGQRMRDVFHMGDVFVDGIQKRAANETIARFVNALFGSNLVTPSKDEYGLYVAKSASFRSADLSRQVGAAILSEGGELITQGCNEVPKAFGGTYWDGDENDA